VEKVICGDNSLQLEDEKLNNSFNEVLKQTPSEKQKNLRRTMSTLLRARDECKNLYGLLDHYPTQEVSVGVEDSEIFPIKDIHYQKACIKTWYDSINFVLGQFISKEESFILPTYQDYISLFKKISLHLKHYPFDFGVSIPVERGENTREKENALQLFFGKNKEHFAAINETFYFHNAGTAHGQFVSTKYFLAVTNNEIVKMNDLESNSYQCSVPIKDPITINGRIYLPENISFTKVFNKMFGEHEQFQPYVCTGSYKPDCMLRLRALDTLNDKDSYLLFTLNYISNLKDKNDQDIDYNPDCFYEILKQHSLVDDSLKQFCVTEYEKCVDAKNNECLLTSESAINRIKNDLLSHNSCKK
jgi:hypothetical protein